MRAVGGIHEHDGHSVLPDRWIGPGVFTGGRRDAGFEEKLALIHGYRADAATD
ncbi:hypothetical protein [Streptomyces lanatus]|uniref:Uncharacterized protein n=1 Tax=Streptomyces lanatus TaxID=66900 RepID=A0ABV1Y0G7_9ACTN|nr:hypothetical protein [Streptomyces lanatus]GHH23846.1 hypothetical protein GCM10018780_73710 [Streptomyces lanatus]